MGVEDHKKDAWGQLSVGIITVSSTRNLADDKSGHWIGKRTVKEGHKKVLHLVVPDDQEKITETVLDSIENQAPDILIVTGGTGITPQDVTIEAIKPLFEKELTAFGPLFTNLSFEEIDSAALLSRATAGIVKKTVIFCIPGSIHACKLACKELIFPEIGHLLKHVRGK